MPDPMPALAPGSLTLPAQPRVLVLGDSYTEGYGAEPETKGWAYLVGKPLGWKVTVDGIGGTGYLNPGPHNEGNYLQRLPKLQGRTFDLVVLQGGSNDRDATYPVLQDAVTRTIDTVRAEFPGTKILLLGPATPYGKPDEPRITAQCVLAGHAVAQDLPFVDPLGEAWFVDGDGDRYANPVNGHPSNAGYKRIAARFETDVRVLLGETKPS
ncbi:SGNH/GDSL hydrolase family protein [Microlunatus spumicola]|uniref:SGNH/GDSL hydrolase family protein n=2 Tax=Microlunatus spumicola TaxID=81499 RepID=A0ABP6X434_9ACTN